ncbi:hypothetical protein ACIOFV_50170 [Streptomyces mirabilis]|uniref:hypothetical protein n=1 Tax=Streptomyces mirabilis TaxID=68239 RepID=UPI00381571CF
MSRPNLALPTTRSSTPQQPTLDQQETDGAQQQASPGRSVAVRSAGVLTELTAADVSATLTVDQLPTPYDVAPEVASPLNAKERQDLEVCEQALHGFRKALIVAGKALEVINRGRLYREKYGTFADYVWEVWGFKRAHAYRLIEEWPVAVACLRFGDINEMQARELLPVWKSHGPEATVALYREVRDLAGQHGKARLSAADLAEAREVLPRRLATPEQVSDVLRLAAAEGRVPRIVPPRVEIPEQPSGERAPTAEDLAREDARAGAEGIAVLEAALAQQKQIYDRLAGVVPQALMYDPGRTELLLAELRQYANRTAYRARGRAHDADAE